MHTTRFALLAFTLAFFAGLGMSRLDITVEAQTPQYARGINRTFAAQAATGATGAFDTFNAATHTTQLVVTGTPVGCTYRLQGSNDGANWFDISGADITCTSSTVAHVADEPARYVRGNLLTLSGGTAPTVTLAYSGQ